MQIAFSILLIFIYLVGFGLVLVTLPGTWLIFLSTVVYAFFFPFDQGQTHALWVLGILLGLALLGELVEFVVGTFGSKTVKVSNGAIVVAFIGGLVGVILGAAFFLVGALVGVLLGSFLGALIYEWVVTKDFREGFVAACAVLATRVVAITLKSSIALSMGVYATFKLF
ncbi:MAG: DUF456 domain-containing protein [Deltaproteobacteria bacterium]|nr:DUF456 domain-containing protein [Deltaproteobacteria bacterium]